MRIRLNRGFVLAALFVAGTLVGPAASGTERVRGLIVYWRESPVPSIWSVRPDGSRNHRILRTRQNAKRPRLSPDRRWVAFDGAPPGKAPLSDFDIQIVRLNGNELHTLTRTPDWDSDAQWSPNGEWLSFTRSPPSPVDCTDGSVWIIRRDGSDARRLVDGCGARWSPDGKKLVYTSPDGRKLRVVEVTGGTAPPLLSGPRHAYQQPAGWSPNGKKILFTRSYDQSGGSGDVFVMKADGTDVRKLAHGFAGSWSRDGSKIVYTRSFWSGLFVMNANGSHKRRVLAGQASEPDWH
jgi:Tol biopolymer transport system component